MKDEWKVTIPIKYFREKEDWTKTIKKPMAK